MYVTDRSVTRKDYQGYTECTIKRKLYGAGAVAADTVTSITGMPINYYVEFSFDTVDKVMDILGPVGLTYPIEGGGRALNYDDPTQDLQAIRN